MDTNMCVLVAPFGHRSPWKHGDSGCVHPAKSASIVPNRHCRGGQSSPAERFTMNKDGRAQASRSGARQGPRSRAPLFAALDLGTNNCRMLIAAADDDGGLRVVDGFSRIVRLGEGLAHTGRLSDEAMARVVPGVVKRARNASRRAGLSRSAASPRKPAARHQTGRHSSTGSRRTSASSSRSSARRKRRIFPSWVAPACWSRKRKSRSSSTSAAARRNSPGCRPRTCWRTRRMRPSSRGARRRLASSRWPKRRASRMRIETPGSKRW